jgi:tetratricopeptide (TPR) repeat protein
LVALARSCLAPAIEARPRDAGAVALAVSSYRAGVEARLRAAELARVEAQARAAEEAKRRALADELAVAAQARAASEARRRRAAVALAAAVLVLVVLGGGAGAWYVQQRRDHQVRVNLALDEVERLRDAAARDPGGDVARWRDAQAALKSVDEHLAGFMDARAAARSRALSLDLAVGLDSASADREFVDALEEIRSANFEEFRMASIDADYAAAFRRFGLDPDGGDPAAVGVAIAWRPPGVASAIAAALDDWAMIRRALGRPAAAWRRPLAAARAAEPDPWRRRLRDALDRDDADALRRLADDPELDRQPADNLVLLGAMLERVGEPGRALAVHGAAARSHPADFWAHQALVRLNLSARPPRYEEELRHATAAAAARPNSVGARNNLGTALDRLGRHAEAVAEFREALRLRPEAVVVASNLGKALNDLGRHAEAEAELREALRRRPDYVQARVNRGIALQELGRPAEAMAEFRGALRLRPDDPVAHHGLGLVLHRLGKPAAAVAEYREALRLRPDDPVAHSNLGGALRDLGKPAEAIAEVKQAIRLRPNFAEAPNNLGHVLRGLGKPAEAIVELRKALRLRPNYPGAHLTLGIALEDLGRLAEAVAEYREAARQRPDYPEAHYNLGSALTGLGKRAEAVAELREALRLRPDYAAAHNNLGNALRGLGKTSEAAEEYREAIRLRPDSFEFHFNLGDIYRARGRYAEALAEIRKGHELGSKRPGWRYPSAAWVKEAERLVALEARLPAVLTGADRPRDAAEQLGFATMASVKGLPAAAERLYEAAFASKPELVDDLAAGHRYNAACAAALAGCAKGKDDPAPDAAARTQLRAKALDWLKADLDLWRHRPAAEAPRVVQMLKHWLVDPELAGVRDAEELARLPAAERAAWAALWAGVDGLRLDTTFPADPFRHGATGGAESGP